MPENRSYQQSRQHNPMALYMQKLEFLEYLLLMDQGYTGLGDTWVRYRTDDILVLEDQRRINLICVGTEPKFLEWAQNFNISRHEWLDYGRVHDGFAHNVIELLGSQSDANALINHPGIQAGKSIVTMGHSRGAPIAMLLATLMEWHGITVDKVVTCAPARIGNRKFTESYNRLFGNKTFTLYSPFDPVSKVPPWASLHGQITRIKVGSWWKPKHRLKWYIDAVSKV